MNTYKLWRSGQVMRWHQNPEIAVYQQNNAAHQWGCVALLLHLHPDPSIALIRFMITHDVGELDAGDMAGPAKRSRPAFMKIHEALETECRHKTLGPHLAGSEHSLNDEELQWSVMIDRLEAFLFVSMHRPDRLNCDGWGKTEKFVRDNAAVLGCEFSVHDLIEEAKGNNELF